LSVTCDRSVVFSGFLHQYNWLPRYTSTIVESGIKHHKHTHTISIVMVTVNQMKPIFTVFYFDDLHIWKLTGLECFLCGSLPISYFWVDWNIKMTNTMGLHRKMYIKKHQKLRIVHEWLLFQFLCGSELQDGFHHRT